MGRPPQALTTPTWCFACPDWVQRLREHRSLVPDLPIDRKEGDRAVALFNKLRLPDVVGQPTMAEAAGDWFRDIVRSAFGSLDKLTGAAASPRSSPWCRRRIPRPRAARASCSPPC
jgi:phage terminase large subunit-like protein